MLLGPPGTKTTVLEKNYHKLKSECAEINGFRCIHVWDWDDKDKIISTFLKSRNTFGARECEIKEVPKKEEVNFLNTYHFQGYIKSETAIGLYKNEELLSIMTFGKPRYSKKYDIEILRLCSKDTVVGDASKLLNYYVNKYNPKSIISYCDLSKFNGNVYKKLDFKRKSCNIGRH